MLCLRYEINLVLALIMVPICSALIGYPIGWVIGLPFRRRKVRIPDFSYLPEIISEFVTETIRNMRYKKNVRAEVAAELVNHFEDELKDCKTEDEKQRLAQKLIEEFGDAKMLGALMRRAKKRCRPLWRTIIVRGFQAIGIGILLLVLYVGWFLCGTPKITVNYVAQANEMVRPIGVDENQNAAPYYLKAAKMFEELKEKDKKADLAGEGSVWYVMRNKFSELSVEDKDLLKVWLDENREILELVTEGSKKPYYWQKYSTGDSNDPGVMMSILMPHLSQYRPITYALCHRAQFQAEAGLFTEVFDDLKTSYILGNHQKNNATLIEALVAIAIEAIVVQNVQEILSTYDVDSNSIALLQSDFEKMISTESLGIRFEGEKFFMYDEIQRTFTGGKRGHISRAGIQRIARWSDMNLDDTYFLANAFRILFAHPNKQKSMEQVERYYDFVVEMAERTPAELDAEEIDWNAEVEELVKGNILLDIFAPAMRRVAEMSHQRKAEVEGTIAIMAIIRYQQDTGSLPYSLRQLVKAGYLKELPIDPYSDGPLVYKQEYDEFVLYSIGPDFVDDDGVSSVSEKGKARPWKDNGDTVFWPIGD